MAARGLDGVENAPVYLEAAAGSLASGPAPGAVTRGAQLGSMPKKRHSAARRSAESPLKEGGRQARGGRAATQRAGSGRAVGRAVVCAHVALPVGVEGREQVLHGLQRQTHHAVLAAYVGQHARGAQGAALFVEQANEVVHGRAPVVGVTDPTGLRCGFAHGLAPQGFGALEGDPRLAGIPGQQFRRFHRVFSIRAGVRRRHKAKRFLSDRRFSRALMLCRNIKRAECHSLIMNKK